jgi:hypothetical protein
MIEQSIERTTISISRKNRDRLRNCGRAGDTSNDVITTLLNIINKEPANINIPNFKRPSIEKDPQLEMMETNG